MTMPVNEKLYISREGSFLTPQPIQVRIGVGDEGPSPRLDAAMPLDGFLAELAARMTHPVGVWTRAQLETALRTAAAEVVVSLKHEIARVM